MPRPSRAARVRGLVALLLVLAAVLPVDEVAHDLVFRYVVSHEVRLLANGFTFLGTFEAGAGLLGALAIVGYRTADSVLWQGSVGGVAGLMIGGVASQLVKNAVCRARPNLVDGWGVGSAPAAVDPVRHGFFHWPCVSRWRYHSFPSGHAMTAFAVAAALAMIAPKRRPLWLAIAVGIGASRVLLNAHFVSDVLGGGLIGWWAGQAGLWLAPRFVPRLGPRPRAPVEVPADERAGTPLA